MFFIRFTFFDDVCIRTYMEKCDITSKVSVSMAIVTYDDIYNTYSRSHSDFAAWEEMESARSGDTFKFSDNKHDKYVARKRLRIDAG